MSERTQNRSQKSERRLAAQLAAQKAAEAKRRRQAWAGGLAGVAVVAVLITVFVTIGRNDDGDKNPTASGPSAGADASAPPAAAPGAPQLPAGADPALGSKPTVTAGTGELTKLIVTPLIKGTGPAVKAGQTVTANYVGVFFKDGKEFDSSWSEGQPVPFPIGVGGVIPGWDQGLVGVTVGSRVQLDIPTELAYGEKPTGGRPAGPLRFVVDVLAAQ
ncbi:FKBP-type peptidyl-prolyl cis-trans isomerase [Micromonospora peucetia]|uniref:Peptidyl-prolyl cis-trans isomerase n=1 Tax=Micromonospora peucetia TaxID=47871 RepID=A0A1C6UNZ6_9ACTN|nr:FKBP-type peptidyl-prolyl cis-trans isomerase [Micromonospora peucetia]MCX4387109.1 FKBP-type peptidyl-prolyl cis-trans isomerase [Micromonospora peucetia]WSA34469.1 FKBP-type peptidyl-prolyl cis-trans isomerase [Micromonospora peucetia]SCL55643.1 peptidylprolyl isomerase [Micromonospora peucetia]